MILFGKERFFYGQADGMINRQMKLLNTVRLVGRGLDYDVAEILELSAGFTREENGCHAQSAGNLRRVNHVSRIAGGG